MGGQVLLKSAIPVLAPSIAWDLLKLTVKSKIIYDALKHVKEKVWYPLFSGRETNIDHIYLDTMGKREQKPVTFDDELKAVLYILENCWPQSLPVIFEQSNGEISNLTSLESLDDFYAESRTAMAECSNKEIILFRHNIFDIIKEDYPYIIKSLGQGNKINVIISGTPENLQESTFEELNFLLDNPLMQKLLVETGRFSYSSDVCLNHLLSHTELLLSMRLLLDAMRRSRGNLTVSLNDSPSTIRGQILEEGETFFIKFPQMAPEFLGEGYSSTSDELRNQFLGEMTQFELIHVSTEDELRKKMKNTAQCVQELLDRNQELGNINLEEKNNLKKILDFPELSSTMVQFNQNRLEDIHKKVFKTVMENESKAFEMYELWKKYGKIRQVFVGGFDEFLNVKSRFSVKKCKIKNSETKMCFFHSKNGESTQ